MKAKEEKLIFENEILEGLMAYPKRLSTKFLYDESGDSLFQQLMEQPDYYLYQSEYEIIKTYTQSLVKLFFENSDSIDLIDFGSGDGKKTKVLLNYLAANDYQFTYKPIDISPFVLRKLRDELKIEIPGIKIEPQAGEYFEILQRLGSNNKKKVILVLGSNIGNLDYPTAVEFLSRLKEVLNKDDLLFIGFDRRKNPQLIWEAYNDKNGITSAFIKNILTRLNRELGADFKVDNFLHWTDYNPVDGIMNNSLVASEEMTVRLKKLNTAIHLKQWEVIQVAISKKFSREEIEDLVKIAGLKISEEFNDSRNLYTNFVFELK